MSEVRKSKSTTSYISSNILIDTFYKIVKVLFPYFNLKEMPYKTNGCKTPSI